MTSNDLARPGALGELGAIRRGDVRRERPRILQAPMKEPRRPGTEIGGARFALFGMNGNILADFFKIG